MTTHYTQLKWWKIVSRHLKHPDFTQFRYQWMNTHEDKQDCTMRTKITRTFFCWCEKTLTFQTSAFTSPSQPLRDTGRKKRHLIQHSLAWSHCVLTAFYINMQICSGVFLINMTAWPWITHFGITEFLSALEEGHEWKTRSLCLYR